MNRALCFAPLSVALLSGCVLDDVPLDALACPCAEGWRCEPVTERCVRGDGGATPADAGADAGARDGGTETDAGDRDGGRSLDASMDAGRDGGLPPVDGGRDGGDAGAGLDETVCDELSPAPLFCDGFESGLVPWTGHVEVDGTARTSSPMPYRGSSALLAETTSASGKASVSWDFPSAITAGPLHARAYVYVPSFAVSGVSLLFLGESAPPYLGIAVQLGTGGAGQVYLGTTAGLATGGTRTAFPRDRWVCVTLDLVVDSSGSVRATVDGTVIADQSAVDTRPAAGMSKLICGIEYTPPDQPSAEVHVDELVVSTAPIPCD